MHSPSPESERGRREGGREGVEGGRGWGKKRAKFINHTQFKGPHAHK